MAVEKKINGNAKQVNELSKEQLKEIADQLYQENLKLKERVNQLYLADTFKRIELLFEVINSSYPFKKDFRDKCADEIEVLMTPVEEENTKEASEKKEEVKKD